MTNLKQMTAHLRGRISHEGIKARVRMAPGGGSIQVFPVAYDISFTEDEQRTIRFIAKVNKLTLVRGMEIQVEQMTDPSGMEFYP